jgi:antitoxin component of MazEF toxin-antitoxin module
MKSAEMKLARIGNSRGIRLAKDLIERHGFENGLILEDRGHEIALRPKDGPRKLSWEDTAAQMANTAEDWSSWDGTSGDGLDAIPWEPKSLPKKNKSIVRKRGTKR